MVTQSSEKRKGKMVEDISYRTGYPLRKFTLGITRAPRMMGINSLHLRDMKVKVKNINKTFWLVRLVLFIRSRIFSKILVELFAFYNVS